VKRKRAGAASRKNWIRRTEKLAGGSVPGFG
jgi:hypothetical protein